MADWESRKFSKLCWNCEFAKNQTEIKDLVSKIRTIAPLGYTVTTTGGYGNEKIGIRVEKR